MSSVQRKKRGGPDASNSGRFASSASRVSPSVGMSRTGMKTWPTRLWIGLLTEAPYWAANLRARAPRPLGLGPSEAETLQLLGVALPVLGHLDVQVEVDLLAEERLDALARVRADLTQPGAPTSDDDRLLARALHEDVDPHVEQRLVLGAPLPRHHLLDDDGQRVRQLVAHTLEGGLPDELGDHHHLRLVGEHAVGV